MGDKKMESDTASVLLADDHVLYREGLRELFGHWSEFEVVGDVNNGQEAIDFCRKKAPDLILMDVQMPVLDGVEATGVIHQEFPGIHIVMLTVTVDEEYVFQAIRNGAKGYLLKDTPGRQLRNRLQRVMQGEAVLASQVTPVLFNELKRSEANPPASSEHARIERLTENEIKVLRLVALGLSNGDIGATLFQSEGTVKKTLGSAMSKLQLENRVQAAVYATRHGLLD
ncbi:MAG: response regulator transcription factor [Eggerthellaceae bacterium]|nr:response regulator transcription factor [Eggerthellaceae bacterium]MDR2715534.1 response regulator transcription factor [Coriobacteriaceae bacterium]